VRFSRPLGIDDESQIRSMRIRRDSAPLRTSPNHSRHASYQGVSLLTPKPAHSFPKNKERGAAAMKSNQCASALNSVLLRTAPNDPRRASYQGSSSLTPKPPRFYPKKQRTGAAATKSHPPATPRHRASPRTICTTPRIRARVHSRRNHPVLSPKNKERGEAAFKPLDVQPGEYFDTAKR